MSKKRKALLAVVLCLAITASVFTFVSGTKITETNTKADREFARFVDDLTSIYKKYDADIDERGSDSEFAFRRLLVNGFNGDTYGAADYAYDKVNDFAVLQYTSEAQARNALNAMLADGVNAEPDGIAKLDAESKCSFDTGVSETLGVPSYLESYNMDYDDIIVAVIDTGVMYDHSAIADRFYSTGVDLSGDEKEDAYYDTEEETSYYSHGTFVSGIIADNTPDNVKIQPYKVIAFGTTTFSASSIVTGINSAIQEGASVINISLHTTASGNSISNAVRNAVNKGICVCASAGNNAKECNAYPACSPGAITVSAVNGKEFASFSNYGEVIDFSAPGTNIRSTWAGSGGATFKRWSGTSFSTPLIAALCADIKCMDKNCSKDTVYNILKDYSEDYGEEGYDVQFGYGVPDIGNIQYTDGESYLYRLPEGSLDIYGTVDYTAETQPWRLFASKLVQVNVDSTVARIGDYNFYNVQKADFHISQGIRNIGDYAFYNCDNLGSYTFDIEVESIGYKAFAETENFEISGYRNTPAEVYALSDDISFNALGCKHNYIFEVFDPTETEEGYTLYTCTVCGDTYIGPYIAPVTVASGKCGENLTFTVYDNGKLVIDGSGAMYDYYEKQAPWYNERDNIQILEIRGGVESISQFAFYGCSNIAKIRCYSSNQMMYSDEINLISKVNGELILTAAKNKFEMPDEIENVAAPAFIMTGNIAVEPNDNFTVADGILYDKRGNIVAALPSYAGKTLVISKNITVKRYAFMFTQYPETLDTSLLKTVLEPYSVGYYYNGTMNKTNLVVRASSDSMAYTYADENGFTVNGYDIGKCGEDMTWRYNSTEKSLIFSGSGDMYTYAQADVPWKSYLATATTVLIGDEISSVSPYSFNGAKALTRLTLPLSLKAPADDKTWAGCTAIKTLTLTYGSGYMDDYLTEDETNLYKFTPWYLSRSSITSFSLDGNVKYIGKEAFRNCLAIKELTLNSIEEIGEYAFVACSNFKKLTITNKQAVLPDYSVLSYRFGTTPGIYASAVLYAYDDSTAHDYAKRLNVTYESLGCGHSRDVVLLDDTVNDSGERIFTYHCNDCDKDFTEIAKHDVSIRITTTTGYHLSEAEVYIGSRLAGVTDENGELNTGVVLGGNYEFEIKCHDEVILSDELYVDGTFVIADVKVRYGDFVKDGVINAKDYAYVLTKGYDEAELFDYGRIKENDNQVMVLNYNRVVK